MLSVAQASQTGMAILGAINVVYLQEPNMLFQLASENLHWVYTICWAAAVAKSPQPCPTLCDPIDGSPPGPSIPGILQARTLGVGCHFLFQCMKWKVKVKSLSRVRLLATPWTAAYQAPPSMGFSRQEYWSGVPLPSPICWAQTCKHKGPVLILRSSETRQWTCHIVKENTCKK